LPREFVREEVQRRMKVPPEVAEAMAALADGSLERALELDADRLADGRGRIERFEAVDPQDLRTVLRFAEEAGADREEAEATLALLNVWVRDVAVVRAGGTALFHPELRVLAEKVASHLGEDALHRRFRLIDEARLAIRQHNAAPRLQLERMLLEMQA